MYRRKIRIKIRLDFHRNRNGSRFSSFFISILFRVCSTPTANLQPRCCEKRHINVLKNRGDAVDPYIHVEQWGANSRSSFEGSSIFFSFQRASVGAEGGRLLVREPPRFLFHIARNQFVNNVNPRRKRPSGIPSRALARVFKSGMAAGGRGEDRRTRRSDRGVTDGNEKGRGRGTRDRRLSQLWELNACMKRWIISEKGFAAESLSLSLRRFSREPRSVASALRRNRARSVKPFFPNSRLLQLRHRSFHFS